MPPRAERSLRRLAGRGLLGLLAVLVAIPAYLTLDVAWRPIVLRLACALIVVAACMHVRQRLRPALEEHAPSVLDEPPPLPPEPSLDGRFQRLRDDLVYGSRSQLYFDRVLGPRLRDLAGGTLAMPPERRWIRRRGPSRRELGALIAEIEERA